MPVLHVNGADRMVDAAPEETLLSVLRDTLALTGTKYGCGEGQCGACTVLVDGRAMRSCQTRVSQLAGRRVTTIEHLGRDALHPIQQAFLDHEALQCGYCTPGMIMAAAALLERTPSPSRAEIGAALEGNICRCGAYPRIVAAVEQAAATLRTESRNGGAR